MKTYRFFIYIVKRNTITDGMGSFKISEYWVEKVTFIFEFINVCVVSPLSERHSIQLKHSRHVPLKKQFLKKPVYYLSYNIQQSVNSS